MALKSDIQALINVSTEVNKDVGTLSSLKELIVAIENYVSTKGVSTIDVYFRGVNDTEYRINLATNDLKSLIEAKYSQIDTSLAAKSAVDLLNAEITKLGGK